MKFVKVDREEAQGTGYQGLLHANYTELSQLFGEPEGPTSDGKVRAQWTIKVLGSVIITIYDYKEEAEPVRTLGLWHIGGKTNDVTEIIDILIKQHRKDMKRLQKEGL